MYFLEILGSLEILEDLDTLGYLGSLPTLVILEDIDNLDFLEDLDCLGSLHLLGILVDLHHAGMVEGLADFLFALKAVEGYGVGFHFRVGELDRDITIVRHVVGSKNGRHATPGYEFFDFVVVESIAGLRLAHAVWGFLAFVILAQIIV